jgi:hypothetical protein
LKIDDGKTPHFAERLLTVNNELTIDQKANVITINNLLAQHAGQRPGSDVKNGKIQDYENARKFDDLKMFSATTPPGLGHRQADAQLISRSSWPI